MKKRTKARKMIQAIIYVVVGFVFSVLCLFGTITTDVLKMNLLLKIIISLILAFCALLGICLVDYATTYIWGRIGKRWRRIRKRRN